MVERNQTQRCIRAPCSHGPRGRRRPLSQRSTATKGHRFDTRRIAIHRHLNDGRRPLETPSNSSSFPLSSPRAFSSPLAYISLSLASERPCGISCNYPSFPPIDKIPHPLRITFPPFPSDFSPFSLTFSRL